MEEVYTFSAVFLCFRALHWVTIQMLCVSMDEEIPEVSENVVKAITGQDEYLKLLCDCLLLSGAAFKSSPWFNDTLSVLCRHRRKELLLQISF